MGEGYQVMTQTARVKLDANENPFGLHSELRRRLMQRLAAAEPSRYPESDCASLRCQLADFVGVEEAQVLVGSGSNELIQLLMVAYRSRLDRVVLPWPTFSMYGVTARTLGLEVVHVPLAADFSLDVPALEQAVAGGGAVLFLCHPNNPTGNCFSRSDMLQLLGSEAELIVSDEAYGEFGGESLIDQTRDEGRLVVLKTLSKAMGLAGLRVGYLIANPATVPLLQGAKPPYNVSLYSQLAAQVVLEEPELQLETVQWVKTEREVLWGALQAIPGLRPCPSESNFILVEVIPTAYGRNAYDLWQWLASQSISVRYFPGEARLESYLRISVGRPEENQQLLQALQRGGETP